MIDETDFEECTAGPVEMSSSEILKAKGKLRMARSIVCLAVDSIELSHGHDEERQIWIDALLVAVEKIEAAISSF
jgi:hypothetical protein